MTTVAIVGGIAPERLQQIAFRRFAQFFDDRNFALIDPETLLSKLRGLIIRVNVSDRAQTVKQFYCSSPSQPTSTGLEILGNIYKIRLGEQFMPLLEPGQKLNYTIEVDQIARSAQSTPLAWSCNKSSTKSPYPRCNTPACLNQPSNRDGADAIEYVLNHPEESRRSASSCIPAAAGYRSDQRYRFLLSDLYSLP